VTIFDQRDVVRAAPLARRLHRESISAAWGMCPTDRPGRPQYCITNLGQFDYGHGRMRLTSYHPGQSIEKIQAKTGFPLEVAPDLHETEPPTEEEVRLLRERIDPLGVRKLETLSGAQRKELIREILKKEA
jgi:glutaconate CoA-transferase subunit B